MSGWRERSWDAAGPRVPELEEGDQLLNRFLIGQGQGLETRRAEGFPGLKKVKSCSNQALIGQCQAGEKGRGTQRAQGFPSLKKVINCSIDFSLAKVRVLRRDVPKGSRA